MCSSLMPCCSRVKVEPKSDMLEGWHVTVVQALLQPCSAAKSSALWQEATAMPTSMPKATAAPCRGAGGPGHAQAGRHPEGQ